MDQKENSNFVKYMSNPKAFTLRRWFYDLLKVNFAAHDQTIERVSTALLTDKDLEDFGKLIGQVYETGYRKAIDDYKGQLEAMGLQVKFFNPENQESIE